jgi:hypothetical protein
MNKKTKKVPYWPKRVKELSDLYERVMGPDQEFEIYHDSPDPAERGYVFKKQLILPSQTGERKMVVEFQSIETEENQRLLHLLHQEDNG